MDRSANASGTRLRSLGVLGLAAFAAGLASIAPAEQLDDDLIVHPSRGRGYATFVTARDGGPIAVQFPADRAAPVPMDFLKQYGHLFGVRDASKQLRKTRTVEDRIGQTHTTYVQIHAGVPVFSGELRIHQEGVKRP